MTTQQLKRWMYVSLRMARRVYATLRAQPRRALYAEVHGFFEHVQCDYRNDLPHMTGWCNSEDIPGSKDYLSSRPESAALVCDVVEEYIDGSNPYQYSRAEGLYNYWRDEGPGGRIGCCIRAGFDLTFGETGVYGFTAGDIRCIFGGKVPAWAFGDQPLTAVDLRPCSVGWKVENEHTNGLFADLPDAASVFM